MKRIFIVSVIWIGLGLGSLPVFALNYGEGTYGTCQYSSCSISIATSGVANISVTPTSGGSYGVGGDVVEVTTGSSTGYSLLLSATTAQTSLVGTNYADEILPASGSIASPLSLGLDTWGFRIDGGVFGVGPTSSGSGVGAPSGTYAAVPSSSSPVQVATTTAPAVDDPTNIWYGVHAGMQLTADTYTNEITYTALVN